MNAYGAIWRPLVVWLDRQRRECRSERSAGVGDGCSLSFRGRWAMGWRKAARDGSGPDTLLVCFARRREGLVVWRAGAEIAETTLLSAAKAGGGGQLKSDRQT